jgi:hypothetical protein
VGNINNQGKHNAHCFTSHGSYSPSVKFTQRDKLIARDFVQNNACGISDIFDCLNA